MPRIPDTDRLAFFMYENSEDARASATSGATGFIVGIPYPENRAINGNDAHYYLITNWHVAIRDNLTTVRINRTGTTNPYIETIPIEYWVFDRNNDIACCPIEIMDKGLQVTVIGIDVLWNEGQVLEHDIGVGEDLAMVGRFVNHSAAKQNEPIARFGNIAKVIYGNDGALNSYFVDMHSRTGYSGSPVIAYRTPGSDMKRLFKERKPNFSDSFITLLGIHVGSFPEEWKVLRQTVYGWKEDESLKTQGMSGITKVTPAHYIRELLNDPELVKMRKEKEKN